jgi:hypothetical protein
MITNLLNSTRTHPPSILQMSGSKSTIPNLFQKSLLMDIPPYSPCRPSVPPTTVIAVYGLVVSVLIAGNLTPTEPYSLFGGFVHLGAGLGSCASPCTFHSATETGTLIFSTGLLFFYLRSSVNQSPYQIRYRVVIRQIRQSARCWGNLWTVVVFIACGMTGLAAGYAIGIVGDAVSLSLCPLWTFKTTRELILSNDGILTSLIPLAVRPSIFIRIKSVRIDGLDSHFRVSSRPALAFLCHVAILKPYRS